MTHSYCPCTVEAAYCHYVGCRGNIDNNRSWHKPKLVSEWWKVLHVMPTVYGCCIGGKNMLFIHAPFSHPLLFARKDCETIDCQFFCLSSLTGQWSLIVDHERRALSALACHQSQFATHQQAVSIWEARQVMSRDVRCEKPITWEREARHCASLVVARTRS